MASLTGQSTVNSSGLCEGSSNIIIPPNFEWLQSEAPGFSLCGDQIKLLFTPDEFYNAIIQGCREANERISLASLYVGTGILEQKMMDVLNDRLESRGESLAVTVLLDAVRGLRDHSVHSMMMPLIRKHPHCQVSLYHTPQLRGFWLNVLPKNINEVVGVQHIKLFVFDNDIIISGANLSKEYFTDRQDRYMLVSNCPGMANFCHGLIKKLSSVSLRLMHDETLIPQLPHLHPYLSPPGLYEKCAREIIWGFYQKALKDTDSIVKPGDDTWLFPLLQLPPMFVTQDSFATQVIMQSVQADSVAHFSSPYFNMVDEYIDTLLLKSKAKFNILIPHPTQNDFFTAKGYMRFIPELYNATTRTFLQQVVKTKQTERVSVGEFWRPSGSYHCKGIWITDRGQETPHITVIGSSNFNYRSVKKDLEYQVVLLTSNQSLRRSLEAERQRLYKHGVPLTLEAASRPDRLPRLWHHLFLWIFKSFL